MTTRRCDRCSGLLFGLIPCPDCREEMIAAAVAAEREDCGRKVRDVARAIRDTEIPEAIATERARIAAAVRDELVWLKDRVPGVEPYRWTEEGEPCYCDTQETVLHPGWVHSLICARSRDDAGAVMAFASRLLAIVEKP